MRKWLSLATERFATKRTSKEPTSYELSYGDFADFILDLLRQQQPPFCHNEWHLATVEVPSDWEAVFELCCHMNALAVCVGAVNTICGLEVASELGEAFARRLEVQFGDTGAKLATILASQLFAEPLTPDHSVFQREDTKEWSRHCETFGRAKAALDNVQIEDRHRLEALSRLGRCMIYASHCSQTRFGAVVPKLRLFNEIPKPS